MNPDDSREDIHSIIRRLLFWVIKIVRMLGHCFLECFFNLFDLLLRVTGKHKQSGHLRIPNIHGERLQNHGCLFTGRGKG